MTDVIPTPTGQQTDFDALQQDLDRARKMTVGDVPTIQDSVDPAVELPRGLHYNGTWQRKATVRELTGVDEEAMARVKEVFDLYDTVLSLGTVRIGECELEPLTLTERQGFLSQLLIGERDLLYIAIVQSTYGDRKTLRYRCRIEGCGEEQDLILTLSEDFQPRQVDDIEETEFYYATSKGDRIAFRPVVGADQVEALRRKNATQAEQNSIILSRCIKSLNGNLIVDPLNYSRGMSMADRNGLLNAIAERQPTVDMTVTIECVACREPQTITLGWGDIFRP